MSRKLLIAALVSITIILVMYGCAYCCAAQAQTESRTQEISAKPMGVFRDFVWGVSEQDVLDYETAIFYKKEGNSLYYLLPRDTSYMPSLKPVLRYDFTEGKLSSAEFDYFDLQNPDSQVILDLFTRHELELAARFGKPAKEEFNWKDEYYRKFPHLWSRALYSRDLWLRTTWNKGDTEVVLQVYRERDQYRLFYRASKIVPQEIKPADILQMNVVPENP